LNGIVSNYTNNQKIDWSSWKVIESDMHVIVQFA